MAFVRNRGDHHAGLAGRVAVGHAPDLVPEQVGYGPGPLRRAGADDHRMTGPREPEGQAAALVPGAAEDADGQAVDGRGFALSHASILPDLPARPTRGTSTREIPRARYLRLRSDRNPPCRYGCADVPFGGTIDTWTPTKWPLSVRYSPPQDGLTGLVPSRAGCGRRPGHREGCCWSARRPKSRGTSPLTWTRKAACPGSPS